MLSLAIFILLSKRLHRAPPPLGAPTVLFIFFRVRLKTSAVEGGSLDFLCAGAQMLEDSILPLTQFSGVQDPSYGLR